MFFSILLFGIDYMKHTVHTVYEQFSAIRYKLAMQRTLISTKHYLI